MKLDILLLGLSLTLALSGCSRDELMPGGAEGPESDAPLPQPGQMCEGVIDVLFTEEISGGIATRAGSGLTGNAKMDSVAAALGKVQLQRLFPPAGKFEARHRAAGLHRWYRLAFPKNISAEEVREIYSRLEGVEKAEPVYQIRITDRRSYVPALPGAPLTRSVSADVPLTFNDPRLKDQWHYDAWDGCSVTVPANVDTYGMGMAKAWQVTGGDPRVIVAVIDMGVDYEHKDLAANMWVNTGEIPGNGLDDDGNGYIDDVHGYDFWYRQGDIIPGPHGTHVAGTVAALNNNGLGVCGVAGGTGNGDGVRIMSCGTGTETQFTGNPGEAIIYAADNGASIIQCSWVVKPTEPLKAAIDYFVSNAGTDEHGNQTALMKGGLAVFAAGNENIRTPQYPAAWENTLSVAAVNQLNCRAGYSNYGEWIDISAPGGYGDSGNEKFDILSTLPKNKYGWYSGTSMAAPHVSGVAALIISVKGKTGYIADDLRRDLLASCMPLNETEENAALMGKGVLRADLALWHPDREAPEKVNDLQLSEKNGKLTLTWSVAADKNDGQARTYTVYYRTASPADGQGAQWVKVSVAGKKAGDPVVYQMPGLKTAGIWYIAVAGSDPWGNYSPLSNEVTYQTIADDAIKAYPNPMRHELHVMWGRDFGGNQEIRLYDSAGRLVKTAAAAEKGAGKVLLGVSDLAAGRYTLQFSANGSTRTSNLIKTAK